MGPSKLTQMSPRRALIWLLPGGVALAAVGTLVYFDTPPLLVFGLSVAGLIPTVAMYAWGALKFRSYYEAERTRADLWTMVPSTVISLAALAIGASLFVAALHSYDALTGQSFVEDVDTGS